MNIELLDIHANVIAKTYMNPGPYVIEPGTKGVVIERQEIRCRHKVRFENGFESWATTDLIKLDPNAEQPKKTDA